MSKDAPNLTPEEQAAEIAVNRWKAAGIEFALIVIMRQAYLEGYYDGSKLIYAEHDQLKSLARRYMEIHQQIITKGGWQQFKYWLQNEVKDDR